MAPDIVIRIVVGLSVLLAGRKLFWLFVGGVGFFIGLEAAAGMLQGQPYWVVLLVALAAGVLGCVLAIFYQGVAIALAGFLSGGVLVAAVLNAFGVEPGPALYIAAFFGGILGAVLTALVFSWALIFLSSLLGAALILRALPLPPAVDLIAGVVLFVVGFLVQTRTLHAERA